MHKHHRNRALIIPVLAGIFGAASPLHPALAQRVDAAAADHKRFDIPAGTITTVLRAFAETSDLQLVYSTEVIAGAESPGVSGSMSEREALTRLLEGTGLTFRFAGERTVTIEKERSGARVLGAVRVQGAEYERPERGVGVAQLGGIRGGQEQEARGYRPVTATIGAGAPTAMEDIPRAVSVLTREQIEKQDISDIGEALNRLPGITLIETSDDVLKGAAIISRGFELRSVQVDGDAARPLNIINNGALDMGPYERVELIRGPNGLYVGDGSPGGSLNLVRKRPGMRESLEVTAVGGSWKRRQIGVDYSTPSIAGSPLALRTVASFQDQEFFYGNSDRRNWLLYGIVDAPLGDEARVELGYQHSDIYERGSYNGIRRYAEGPLWDVPLDYNFTPPGVYDDVESNEVFVKFFMDLPRNWLLEAGVSYVDRDLASVQYLVPSTFLQATRAVRPGTSATAWQREKRADSKNMGANVRVSGRAHTFGIDHSLFVAGEFNEYSAPGTAERSSSTSKQVATIDDLDPATQPAAVFQPFARSIFRGTDSTRGLVIGDTLSWRNWFDLNLSVRRLESSSSFLGIYRNDNPQLPGYGEVASFQFSPGITNTADSPERKAHWQPSWYLTLKPLRNLSVYGSVSNGTQQQDQYFTAARQSLGPIIYENSEAGMKYGLRDWLATLSVYETIRTNVAAGIPGTMGQCPPNPTSLCYFELGDSMKSKGVELELTGEVVEGLGVSASYSYNSSKAVPGVNDSGRTLYTQAPAREAHLLLDWKLPFMPNTSVNVGASYQSSVYQAGTLTFYDPVTGRVIPPSIPYEFREPSWTVIDAGFSHDFRNDISMNVLVENVTDKQYLSTVSSAYNFVGRPRSVTATLRWKLQGGAPANGMSPTTGLAPFGDPGRWYGSFALGANDPGTLSARSGGAKLDGTRADWDFETGQGEIAFARLGYRLSPHWRAEAEGGFRDTKFGRVSGDGTAPNGVCDSTGARQGRPFNCEDALGEANAWSIMFNTLYDFRAEQVRIRPFVGLGLGLARWSIDFGGKMKGIGSDSQWSISGPGATRASIESIAGDDQSLAWAWQATAGASIRVADRARVTTAYTFYNAPNLKWDSFNMPTLTPTLGTFRSSYRESSLTVGIQWLFGDSPR